MREQDLTAVTSDAELVAGIRAGDQRAMAELHTRHRVNALRVARIVSPDRDAEDLAAEAFARVVDKIMEGGGPTEQFGPYLHTVIRNLNIERIRQSQRERSASDKPWLLDTATVDANPDATEEVDPVDVDRAARALRSLPNNWQQLLWEIEVQGRKPGDVADELSVPVSIVSDTIYRAREGLRLAYLDQHIPDTNPPRCDWTLSRLGRLARGKLSPRATAKVRQHLNTCAECAALHAEVHQLNSRLAADIWPIVLLGGTTLTGSTEFLMVAGAPGQTSPSTPSGRSGLKSAVTPTTLFIAAVATTAVVAVAATGLWLTRDNSSDPQVEAAAPQPDSAPTQVLPQPFKELTPEIELAARDLPPPETVPTAPPAGQTPTVKPSNPAPPVEKPDPEPEAEAEAEPVNLDIGDFTLEPASQPFHWLLTVPIVALEGAAAVSFKIDLELSIPQGAAFVERLSPGWYCGPIEDGAYFFDLVNCQYTYVPGQPVEPFQLMIQTLVPSPTGTITLSSEGNASPDTSISF